MNEITIIQVEIRERTKAMEINSINAGKYYLVEEIEVGTGRNKKTMPYTEGFLKKHAMCKAQIIAPGKIRIIL